VSRLPFLASYTESLLNDDILSQGLLIEVQYAKARAKNHEYEELIYLICHNILGRWKRKERLNRKGEEKTI
jgi:hypothetical protein